VAYSIVAGFIDRDENHHYYYSLSGKDRIKNYYYYLKKRLFKILFIANLLSVIFRYYLGNMQRLIVAIRHNIID